MNNDELKKKIVEVLNSTEISKELSKDDIYKFADALIAAGIGKMDEEEDGDLPCANSVDEMINMCKACDFPECRGCEHTYTTVQEIKRLKDHERADIQNREIFAEKYGFTPDCTPYYIAEQYKYRAEVAEKAFFSFLLCCAKTGLYHIDEKERIEHTKKLMKEWINKAKKELEEEGK